MFRYPIEAVPDALIVVDRDGRIMQANHHAEEMFGYPADGLLGLEVEALMPDGVRARHRQHRNGYMASPRVRTMGETNQALVGLRRDGRQFSVEIALSPISSEDGARYLASIRDISRSQRARQGLVRARYDELIARIGQAALASTDVRSVIEGLPVLLAESVGVEAIAIALLRSGRTGVDIAACLGVDAAPWLQQPAFGRPDGALWQSLAAAPAMVVEDLSALPVEQWFPTLRGEDTGSGAMIALPDRDRPMGSIIALSREPHRFDHDALHLLQSVANMLAAMLLRRRTEEQLAHSQRLDAIGQLTGGIAHDFNNLLTIISGGLQLIEIEFGQDARLLELTGSALRSVARGAELTSTLLAFARRQRLVPRAIDPRSLLQEIKGMLDRTLGESIRLEVACPAGIGRVRADATHLDTALVNLCLNARDAMPRGGEIVLGANERVLDAQDAPPGLAPGSYIVFSVSDTGLGMAPDTLARAVEPFFTTKDAGRGSGLGLSMVYGFARQSGGQLRIESRLGYGTRVDLYLPVADAGSDAGLAAVASATRGDGELVLVVEDEPEVQQIAVAFLKSLGYRTRAVDSAVDALSILADDPEVALLFTDLMLGKGMNGIELAAAARLLRPGLAILMASGYDDPHTAGRQAQDPGFELLRKPYRREQLAEAIVRNLSPPG